MVQCTRSPYPRTFISGTKIFQHFCNIQPPWTTSGSHCTAVTCTLKSDYCNFNHCELICLAQKGKKQREKTYHALSEFCSKQLSRDWSKLCTVVTLRRFLFLFSQFTLCWEKFTLCYCIYQNLLTSRWPPQFFRHASSLLREAGEGRM